MANNISHTVSWIETACNLQATCLRSRTLFSTNCHCVLEDNGHGKAIEYFRVLGNKYLTAKKTGTDLDTQLHDITPILKYCPTKLESQMRKEHGLVCKVDEIHDKAALVGQLLNFNRNSPGRKNTSLSTLEGLAGRPKIVKALMKCGILTPEDLFSTRLDDIVLRLSDVPELHGYYQEERNLHTLIARLQGIQQDQHYLMVKAANEARYKSPEYTSFLLTVFGRYMSPVERERLEIRCKE